MWIKVMRHDRWRREVVDAPMRSCAGKQASIPRRSYRLMLRHMDLTILTLYTLSCDISSSGAIHAHVACLKPPSHRRRKDTSYKCVFPSESRP